MVLIFIFLPDSGQVVRPKKVKQRNGAQEWFEKKRFLHHKRIILIRSNLGSSVVESKET